MDKEKVFAVFGNPIKHSLSPVIHAAFADQFSISLKYTAELIEPHDFKDSVDRFFAAGGCGINVTVPFKKAVIPFLDKLSNEAEQTQSVNTIILSNDNLVGHNTDIVGFTKLSENMEPNQVLELLSKYQTKMVDAIFANGGTVDKFIGDSVMATFGTPISRGNDAQNALNCAKQMQLVMDKWDSDMSLPSNLKIKHIFS